MSTFIFNTPALPSPEDIFKTMTKPDPQQIHNNTPMHAFARAGHLHQVLAALHENGILGNRLVRCATVKNALDLSPLDYAEINQTASHALDELRRGNVSEEAIRDICWSSRIPHYQPATELLHRKGNPGMRPRANVFQSLDFCIRDASDIRSPSGVPQPTR